jgi:DNA-binding NtrC family response regulator
MNQKATSRNVMPGLEEYVTMPDFFGSYSQIQAKPQNQESPLIKPEMEKSLEKIKESLILAYMLANVNLKNIPLKTFMDSFEKQILLTCLRLTHGNQKNAAALLSLKPTALFEKMRKHRIRSQRGKLPGEPVLSISETE